MLGFKVLLLVNFCLFPRGVQCLVFWFLPSGNCGLFNMLWWNCVLGMVGFRGFGGSVVHIVSLHNDECAVDACLYRLKLWLGCDMYQWNYHRFVQCDWPITVKMLSHTIFSSYSLFMIGNHNKNPIRQFFRQACLSSLCWQWWEITKGTWGSSWIVWEYTIIYQGVFS